MLRNEGPHDRAARAVIGIVGAGSGLGIVLLVVAAIMLVTVVTGSCPCTAPWGTSAP